MIFHGIDLTNINRKEFKNKNIRQKILTKDELNELDLVDNKILFIAKRWAIKEAIIKALHKPIPMNEINVYKSNDVYKCIIDGKEFEISTSVEGDFIIASAFTINKINRFY